MKLRRWWPIPLLVLAASGLGIFLWLFGDLPEVESLAGRLNTPSIRIADRQGRLLYEVLPENGGRHTVVPLDEIPLALRQATIATEDRRFYEHPGVDALGIVRALWINLRGGETLAGGSTITQQVARNLLLADEERYERSLRRKLRETVLAWLISQRFSKDEVLALYLNQMNYGAMAYGVEAAAQTYFGKAVSELDLAECALLAGLPQAPALYNPFTDAQAAKQRQQVVLGLMEAEGYITAEQRAQAEREKLAYSSTPYPVEAPHFVMMVRAQLDSLLPADAAYQHGGLVVRTTLDLNWQKLAQNAVSQQIEKVAQDQGGLGHNMNSAALVALDPHSGEILALVGSPDYFDTENGGAINMTLAPRQPGSSIKPLVYAVAFDPNRSNPWTAATMILDVSTSFVTHEGDPYTPVNYDRMEHGPVLARTALASSLNIPAVITLQHIGLRAFFDQAAKMGITTLRNPDEHDLSLALGGGDVRLLELTAAYAAFANGGLRLTPYAITDITSPDGEVLYRHQAQPQPRVLDERVAWLISDILSDNEARVLGFGEHSILRLDRPAAVKTGTTSNFHDNWAIGYTPDLVVGVWAGNTNYEPMRNITGLTGAAPIWHQFMRQALAATPEKVFERPAGLVQVEICALSGLLPTPACPYTRLEWFIVGTEPTAPDDLHRLVTLDRLTGKLATPATPPERVETRIVLDLPPQAAAWAHSQGIQLYADVLVSATRTASPSSTATLYMAWPPPNSVYHLSANLPVTTQNIRLAAVGASDLRQVTIFVDGQGVATLQAPPFETWWTLTAGRHTVWAEGVTASGERLISEAVSFEVIQD